MSTYKSGYGHTEQHSIDSSGHRALTL
jgi:hypothetical protein